MIFEPPDAMQGRPRRQSTVISPAFRLRASPRSPPAPAPPGPHILCTPPHSLYARTQRGPATPKSDKTYDTPSRRPRRQGQESKASRPPTWETIYRDREPSAEARPGRPDAIVATNFPPVDDMGRTAHLLVCVVIVRAIVLCVCVLHACLFCPIAS